MKRLTSKLIIKLEKMDKDFRNNKNFVIAKDLNDLKKQLAKLGVDTNPP